MVGEGVPVDADRPHGHRGWGFPVGPIALLDEIGLDVAHKAAETMHAAYGDRMKSGDALDRMIAAGRLGRKNGRGYYRYRNGRKAGADRSVQGLPAPSRSRSTGSELIERRLVHAMLNEAAAACSEEVVRNPARRRHRCDLRHRVPGVSRWTPASHRRPRRLARGLHAARARGPVRRALPTGAGAGGDGSPGWPLLRHMTAVLRLSFAARGPRGTSPSFSTSVSVKAACSYVPGDSRALEDPPAELCPGGATGPGSGGIGRRAAGGRGRCRWGGRLGILAADLPRQRGERRGVRPSHPLRGSSGARAQPVRVRLPRVW